jgi:multidrug efflux pump subunit AcrA (membrane-fusion protein)
MKLIRGIHNLSQAPHGCVLTIGNFDGVHRGHQALLQGLREEGRARGLPVVVMIFEPQPLELFASEKAPARLTRLREKLRYLAQCGVDYVLVEVVQLDPIRIAFALEEGAFAAKAGQHADLTALKKAWTAQIAGGAGRENGVLTSVDNRIDPRTASVMMRAEFANPRHSLLPGGNATVWLRPEDEQLTLSLPAAAVQQNGDGFYSWVVTPQETAEKRLLTLAGQSGQHFHVLSGVKASERVVTDGAQRLQPGAAVQVIN